MNKTMIQAFTEFADAHQGEIMRAYQINDGVADIYGKTCSMCASDFAEPETSKERSKNNGTLFERVIENGKKVKGKYRILTKEERKDT